MRPWSLISVLLVCSGCTVRLPRPAEIGISMKAAPRVQVGVQARVQTQVEVAPPVAVPLEGAAVVEFFGIPLDDVQDVVFVLDCSGSMSELAQGRIAELGPTHSPPPPPPAGYGDPARPPPAPAPGYGDPARPPPPPPPGADPGSVDPDRLPADAGPIDPARPPDAAPVSRQPRKIDVAQAELVDALERLPAGTRMNVLFFNRDLEAFAPGLVPLDDAARPGLVGFVRETAPTGSTALAPAMRTAFLMNARRIVLLSDGLGNVGGNAQAVLRDAREAMRGGVRIDTIGLGAGQHAALLGTLARESGGLYQPL